MTLFRGGLIAVLDQGVISLSNFLTIVIIAKRLSVDEFGYFTLLYSSLVTINSVSASLVTYPVQVFGVNLNKAIKNKYIYNQIVIQIIIGSSLSLFSGLLLKIGWHSTLFFCLVFSLSVFGIQFQELLRSFNLAFSNWNILIIEDFVNHSTRLVILFTLFFLDKVDFFNIFMAITVGSMTEYYLQKNCVINWK